MSIENWLFKQDKFLTSPRFRSISVDLYKGLLFRAAQDSAERVLNFDLPCDRMAENLIPGGFP